MDFKKEEGDISGVSKKNQHKKIVKRKRQQQRKGVTPHFRTAPK